MKSLAVLLVLLILPLKLIQAEPIKIGVSVSLTGDAATFGQDVKNALLMANREIGADRYKMIIEDDRCDGREAATLAHRFITLEKVDFMLGFACNQALLAAAPIYQRAGIPLISASGTSGDVQGLGDKIFRLFPADHYGVLALFPYIQAQKHSSLGIITEENEYPELMRRTFERLHRENGSPATLIQESFKSGNTDFKGLLLRLKSKQIKALFLNTNAEAAFINLVKQADAIEYNPVIYAAYWPASEVVLQEIGALLEGSVFANLPAKVKLLSAAGQSVLERLRITYGNPNSVDYISAFAYESFRLLDHAIQSGQSVPQYLHSVKVDNGLLGSYSFNSDGAVEGLSFVLQRIQNGKVVDVK